MRGEFGENDERPVIRIAGGSLPQNFKASETALGAMTSADPANGVYQRGGLLVRTARLPVAGRGPDGIWRAAGTLQIRAAGAEVIRLKLMEAACWQRYNQRTKRWIETEAPAEIARTLVEAAGMWPNTPPLHGIIESPSLRWDGSVLDVPGYDPESGLYFEGGSTSFGAVLTSRAAAEAALDELRAILAGFPFADRSDANERPSASESVALAMLMTPLVRHALRAAPMFAISAPKMGSGKTLLSSLPSYIVTGRAPAVLSQSESSEEERKRLLAILLEGAPLGVIDNVERPLKSDALCSVLTEPLYRDRYLGATSILTVPTTTTWIATGNNLRISGDLVSRCLQCSIDPQMERPEERTFARNLHLDVPQRRGVLAAAALTITRAYLAAGAPHVDIPTFGRFEDWSKFVRQPLVWLGAADPCSTRQAIEAGDTTREVLSNLLETWFIVFRDRKTTVAEAKSTCEASTLSPDVQALKTAVLAVAQDKHQSIDAQRLGTFLRKHERRIERNLRFENRGLRNHAAEWSAIKMGGIS